MECLIPADTAPQRADKLLFQLLGGAFSRTHISRLIREGKVFVKGSKIKASTVLRPSEKVVIEDAPLVSTQGDSEPRPISLSILFEDDQIIMIDKPPGLTVHHGGGQASGTLVDILIHEHPEIRGVGESGRWGVVHRLDKDTSGVMVVARTNETLLKLSRQFKEHAVTKIYHAIVRGAPNKQEGLISLSIGRHATDRKRISVAATKSRSAVTKWKILERLGSLALLEIRPETGRTHQIRVHLASAGMPILGDPVYGRLRPNARNIPPLVRECAQLLKRQALHASVLGIMHPTTGRYLERKSPIPKDMETIIAMARKSLSASG